MLLMRMGREKEAPRILIKADRSRCGPMCRPVFNSLKVLCTSRKVRDDQDRAISSCNYDPKTDAASLARYMGRSAGADMYTELAASSTIGPAGPFLVGDLQQPRDVQRPGRWRCPTCTPSAPAPDGCYHGVAARQGRRQTVQLGAGRSARTGAHLRPGSNQVPGAALADRRPGGLHEGFRGRESWNQLLVERLPAGELMNLDNINLGFIRPRVTAWIGRWRIVRVSSTWNICKRSTVQTIGELLTAYRDGLDLRRHPEGL